MVYSSMKTEINSNIFRLTSLTRSASIMIFQKVMKVGLESTQGASIIMTGQKLNDLNSIQKQQLRIAKSRFNRSTLVSQKRTP